MKIAMFQVDAFTAQVFSGNPAGVVPLERWIEDARMQAIAAENNVAETAFFVPEGADYRIRWFTPTVEVDLCGHATLASAHIIFQRLKPGLSRVRFESKSGELIVTRDGDKLAMDFPSRPPAPVARIDGLAEALGATPSEVLQARDILAVFETEEQVRALAPDFAKLIRIETFGIAATAPGRTSDFVSRFFVPRAGVNEDPATGSSHCTLTPYWSKRLGKRSLHARQLSARGGEMWCDDLGERVSIAGNVAVYLEGTIEV